MAYKNRLFLIAAVLLVAGALGGYYLYHHAAPTGTNSTPPSGNQVATTTYVDTGVQATSVQEVMVNPAKVFRLNISQKDVIGIASTSTLPAPVNNGTSTYHVVTNGPASVPAVSIETYVSSSLWSSMINLTLLNLSNDNIGSVPSEIGQLTNLQVLYLGGNQLSTLPPEIGNLKNLWMLSLFQNHISSLPATISQLKSLKVLGLTGNPITQSTTAMAQLAAELPGVQIIK